MRRGGLEEKILEVCESCGMRFLGPNCMGVLNTHHPFNCTVSPFSGKPGAFGLVLQRIGELADGWFALCSPEEYPALRERIDGHAKKAGRDPAEIGSESGLGIHGRTEDEWLGILQARKRAGATHLCMRTLGGELDAKGHLDALTRVQCVLVEEGHLTG